MQYRLISDQLTVLIDSKGAELCSIINEKGIEYIWTSVADIWGRHAPVLFPIVGRLKKDSFIFERTMYDLGQHGFARDMSFKLKEKNSYSCIFELASTTETKKSYPFEFNLEVGYELKANKLFCSYKIKNPSSEPLLFSVGAHPGFNCPLLNGEKYEDYYLEFETSSFVQTTLSDGLRLDKKKLEIQNHQLFLSGDLFNDDALVFENNQVNKIKLCSSKSSCQVILECKGWPYFGIWAKKGTKQFVCLEPWYGIADSTKTTQQLDEKAGIIRLGALAEFSCWFSIEIN